MLVLLNYILITYNLLKMQKPDIELIEKARDLNSIDWDIAFELAGKAQSITAKEQIEGIAKSLYHKEEYCGCL